MNIGRRHPFLALLAASLSAGACSGRAENAARASGYVEATDVRVAPQVGGRLIEVAVSEGDRINTGALVARLDTADADLSLRRAEADRDQTVAALRLLEAGARPEDIRQARAQESSAQADIVAAQSELEAANLDLQRFEALLKSNAGSRKQRDDAATRRDVAAARVNANAPSALASAAVDPVQTNIGASSPEVRAVLIDKAKGV